jgi:glycosyltransferase involved in cell wall biosynthesis
MKKTAPKLTMIITVRGEDPHLARTIRLARETAAHPIHLLVVFDGCDTPPEIDADSILCLRHPRGCMAARHAGILKANTQNVVVVDAHMGFPQGWDDAVNAELDSHPDTVACAQMQSTDADLQPQGPGTYAAARIALRTVEPIDGNPARKTYAAISAKWAHQQAPGEIGCVLGAFYAMRRKWYQAMAMPWSVGTGWGCDEEVISLASFLAGGTVRMMPITVGHVYQMAGQVWRKTADQTDEFGIWRNRLRILQLFPFEEELRSELKSWIEMNILPEMGMAADLARPEVQTVIRRFEKTQARLKEYMDRFIDKPATDQRAATAQSYAEQRTPRQVIHRQMEICKKCNRADSFRVQSTQGERQYLACGCGARAVRMNHGPLQYGKGRYS